MDDVTLIGVDLAKRVFHLHGAAGDGSVVFRKNCLGLNFAVLWNAIRAAWSPWKPVAAPTIGVD